jgi:hypothetical protein
VKPTGFIPAPNHKRSNSCAIKSAVGLHQGKGATLVLRLSDPDCRGNIRACASDGGTGIGGRPCRILIPYTANCNGLEAYSKAAAEFMSVVHDGPLGSPDGVLRMQKVARAHADALGKYIGALKRYNDAVVERRLGQPEAGRALEPRTFDFNSFSMFLEIFCSRAGHSHKRSLFRLQRTFSQLAQWLSFSRQHQASDGIVNMLVSWLDTPLPTLRRS